MSTTPHPIVTTQAPRLQVLIDMQGQKLMTHAACPNCGASEIKAERVVITGNGRCTVEDVRCGACGTPARLFDGNGQEMQP